MVTEIDDVWQCLFGRAEHVQIPKNCSCNSNVSENGENHSSHVPNRDLESTIAGAIILEGEPVYLYKYLPLLIEGTYIPSLWVYKQICNFKLQSFIMVSSKVYTKTY